MPNYKNIEDFDTEWEKKQKVEEEVVDEKEEILEEEVEDIEEVEEVVEDEDEDDEEEIELIEEEDFDVEDLGDAEFNAEKPEPKKKEEPQKKEKAEFAFGQLRKENKEYKEKVSKLEQRNQELEELATSLGYQNAEEMLEAERKRKIAKEAADKGIDPAFYQEFKKTQQELEKIRLEREAEIRNQKLQNFSNELNSVYEAYAFTDTEKQEIIRDIEQDGYSLDDLLTIKSPRKFIMGYAKDKIVDREVQKKLKTDKKDFKEEKFNKGKEKTARETMDEQIKKEMEAYAKERGFI